MDILGMPFPDLPPDFCDPDSVWVALMMVLFCKGMPGENPAPDWKKVGATCSSGRNLLPQREKMLGVQRERKWESKARAYMSTTGLLAQGEIRITLPKSSNKQTNKKSTSKIRHFLLETVGVNVCSIWRLEKMQGQSGDRTSYESSLVPPKSELSLPHLHQHHLSSFLSSDGGKNFSWKAHTLPWVVGTWVCDTASPYRHLLGNQELLHNTAGDR